MGPKNAVSFRESNATLRGCSLQVGFFSSHWGGALLDVAKISKQCLMDGWMFGDFKQPFPIRKELVKIIQLSPPTIKNWLGSLEFQVYVYANVSRGYWKLASSL